MKIRIANFAIEALRAALAEPEVIRSEEGTKDGNPVGDPVAWMSASGQSFVHSNDVGDSVPNWTDYYTVPLYLHPQRRLSDEDNLYAERYRYFIAHFHVTDEHSPIHKLLDAIGQRVPTKDELDTAIDAARALEKEQRK